MTVHVSIEMDEALKARLDALSVARGEPIDVVVAEALKVLSDEDEAFLAAVDQGLASLDAGRAVSHEEVVADALARRAERNRAA
ncbi:hypothetical protein BH10PSE1_BH10PSE1_28840 [soil metagenome]